MVYGEGAHKAVATARPYLLSLCYQRRVPTTMATLERHFTPYHGTPFVILCHPCRFSKQATFEDNAGSYVMYVNPPVPFRTSHMSGDLHDRRAYGTCQTRQTQKSTDQLRNFKERTSVPGVFSAVGTACLSRGSVLICLIHDPTSPPPRPPVDIATRRQFPR